jgi:hypothetical protein
MKKIIFIFCISFAVSSCSIFHRTAKYGCPTNGKNVDAGKLAAGDPKAIKDAKKAPKFRQDKL